MSNWFDDDGNYSPEICEFWQQNRIPRPPQTYDARFLRWFAPDTETNYAHKGNQDFGVNDVGYEFNSLGFRGPEFTQAPGEAVVMFVGDSNTFGIGMPWAQLWTSIVTKHLQQQWGVNVRQCNLGWRGTGPDYAAMMVHQCIDVIRPDAVFVLWSYFDRMAWFPNPGRQVHFMAQFTPAKDTKEHSAYLRLATQSHGFFNYVRDFHLTNSRLQQLGIPYYWGNLEQVPTELLRHYLPLDKYVGDWERIDSDFARDGQHAGPHAHARFAARVIDALERDSVERSQPSTMRTVPIVPSTRLPQGEPAMRTARMFPSMPHSLQTSLAEIKFRRRVRAMKKNDPFIY